MYCVAILKNVYLPDYQGERRVFFADDTFESIDEAQDYIDELPLHSCGGVHRRTHWFFCFSVSDASAQALCSLCRAAAREDADPRCDRRCGRPGSRSYHC